MNVTKLIPESAQKAHQEILLSLGSENNPKQWMDFCETIDNHIPEMSTQGRMSNAQIKQSLIGKLGFDSFKAYIETDVNEGGLGWSIGGWNAYRRAWSLVKKYPYLKDLPIKSGWLNAFATQCRKAGIDFPETLEAYNQAQENKLMARENNKDAKIDDQAKRIIELTDKLKITNIEMHGYKKAHEALSNSNKDLVNTIERQAKEKAELEERTAKLSSTVKQQTKKIENLENRLNKKAKLTRWEALKVAVFGN